MQIVAYWAAALAVGVIALPIAFVLFRRFPDGGAGLAMPLGLTLAGTAYFLLRTFRVLDSGRGGAILALALLGLLGVWFAGHDRRFKATFLRAAPGMLAAFGLFTLLFFSYVSFRSYEPGITHTEQPMDLMYLNAAVNSPHYPPEDPWFAGERASYYYFGYVQAGILTSVADADVATGYNLHLAYTFAAAGTAIASLVFALLRWSLGSGGRRWATGGAAAAVGLLLFVGSLSAPFEWAAAHGQTNEGVYGAFGLDYRISCELEQRETCYSGPAAPARTSEWYPTEFWNWWPGSRVIPNTITEFPAFSFLLGDLHPHVMALPLVLLMLGLAASAFRGRSRLLWRTHRLMPAEGIVTAVIVGALAFMNAWDLLTFSLVFALAVVARNWRRSAHERGRPGMRALAKDSASYLLPIAVLAVVLYLPWYRDFSSQAGGIRPYIGRGTLPAHAFLQFGLLLCAAGLALTFAFREARSKRADVAAAALLMPGAPLLAWFVMAYARGELGAALDDRGTSGWLMLAIYAVAVWALSGAALALAARRNTAAVAAAFAALGAVLLFGSELFFIVDGFEGNLPRMNTVFKLSYQAWTLLSVAAAVAATIALRGALRGRNAPGWLAAPAGALALAGLVYPIIELPNMTGGFNRETTTSDSLAFLLQSEPEEYALARWINANVPPGDVVIEASGRQWARGANGEPGVVPGGGIDYNTAAGRIGSRTGRPTLIGWDGHEVQWRGSAAGVEIVRRQELVDHVYLPSDDASLITNLRTAGAAYVVVGRQELQRFPGDLMRSFDGVLDLAWEQGSTRVYRVPAFAIARTS